MHTYVLYKVLEKFGSVRVVDLLFYGSNASGGNLSSESDFDFYLLLDQPLAQDLEHLKDCISGYDKVDITLQYKSILESKGLNNFQHGNHGLFFFRYLATATSLIGSNYFAASIHKIDDSLVQGSLLFQIDEYFWRLNRSFLYDNSWRLFFKKYIMRICVDMLLLEDVLPYENISRLNHLEILNQYIAGSELFSTSTKELLSNQYNDLDKNLWLQIRQSLYTDYLKFYNKLKPSL